MKEGAGGGRVGTVAQVRELAARASVNVCHTPEQHVTGRRTTTALPQDDRSAKEEEEEEEVNEMQCNTSTFFFLSFSLSFFHCV